MRTDTIFKELIEKGCNKDIKERFNVFMQFTINSSKSRNGKNFNTLTEAINHFDIIKSRNNFNICWDTIFSRTQQHFIILINRCV